MLRKIRYSACSLLLALTSIAYAAEKPSNAISVDLTLRNIGNWDVTPQTPGLPKVPAYSSTEANNIPLQLGWNHIIYTNSGGGLCDFLLYTDGNNIDVYTVPIELQFQPIIYCSIIGGTHTHSASIYFK